MRRLALAELPEEQRASLEDTQRNVEFLSKRMREQAREQAPGTHSGI